MVLDAQENINPMKQEVADFALVRTEGAHFSFDCSSTGFTGFLQNVKSKYLRTSQANNGWTAEEGHSWQILSTRGSFLSSLALPWANPIWEVGDSDIACGLDI